MKAHEFIKYRNRLLVRRTRLKIRDDAFSPAAPRVWNYVLPPLEFWQFSRVV